MNACKHGHIDGVMHIACPHCRIEALETEIFKLRARVAGLEAADKARDAMTFAAYPACDHKWELQPQATAIAPTERCAKCFAFRTGGIAGSIISVLKAKP